MQSSSPHARLEFRRFMLGLLTVDKYEEGSVSALFHVIRRRLHRTPRLSADRVFCIMLVASEPRRVKRYARWRHLCSTDERISIRPHIIAGRLVVADTQHGVHGTATSHVPVRYRSTQTRLSMLLDRYLTFAQRCRRRGTMQPFCWW